MKKFCILLLMGLAACGGDATGSRPSLAGQWLFRMRTNTLGNVPIGCRVYGAVRLTGSGGSFSGRMPLPEASCQTVIGTPPTFDSTTTLTAQVQGDSVLLTLRTPDAEIRQVARILGDSLAGELTGDATGMIAARRYPDSVPLDRANVRMTGAYNATIELLGYGAWNGVRFASATKDQALLLLPTTASRPPLAVGTYDVANSAAVPLYGSYARLVGSMLDPEVMFTGGTVTITQVDAQIIAGTLDVTGVLNGGTGQVRIQADFTSHRSWWPGSF